MKKFMFFSITFFSFLFLLISDVEAAASRLTFGSDFSYTSNVSISDIEDDEDYQKIIDNKNTFTVYRSITSNTFCFNSSINESYSSYATCVNLIGDYSDFDYSNIGIMTYPESNGYFSLKFFISKGNLPVSYYYIDPNVSSNHDLFLFQSETIYINLYISSRSIGNFRNLNNWVYHGYNNTSHSILGSSFDYSIFDSDDLSSYFDTNTNWNLGDSHYVSKSFDLAVLSSSLIDFQETVITNRNIVTGYDFRPKFDNFDTNFYKYQYGFGDSGFLEIEENEHLIIVRGNGLFKIRVINLVDNSVTYYDYDISDIGTIYDDNFEYSIKFDTVNNTDGNNIIDSISINTMFYPISSFFTYEYQFVLEDNDIDDNVWLNINYNDIDEGLPFTYVANNNGTLYVRIKYNDGSVKIQDSYVVDNLGLFTLGANSSQINNSFDKFRRIIDFGSPIGSFIVIPINLMQTLFDSVNNSSGVCNDYSLGSLYGYELHLPCVDVKRYLGNDLYSIIDMIVSCCIIYNLLNMLMNAYYNFLSMQKDPIASGDLVDELRRR